MTLFSHSALDAGVIHGLSQTLKEAGFTVYVYWLDDRTDRDRVSPETAGRLRQRMDSCRSLVYATSQNADSSRWMPWELGYSDGVHGKVAVCPITADSSFEGREYLGLYPVMERDLWLWRGGQPFKRFDSWIKEPKGA